jgi:glycosyltransferase involved in cell wall biosynthesis
VSAGAAEALAESALRERGRGGAAHVLWCGARRPRFAAELARGGVGVSLLEEVERPAPFAVPNVHGECPSERSDRVRTALEQLHERHRFALIVFPALGGLGFRSIQAREAGLAFRGVTLAVYLDGSSARLRERQGRWPEGPDDLEVDYLERYAAEHADARVAPGGPLPDSRVASPRPPGGPAGPPLVTVCVPHFNLGAHLPGALASLAAQTYPHLEVLVVDDGSTDPDSREVFEAMRGRYPRFRFLTQANAGIGATRNRGLREARGDYFLPFDADNVARPDLVERLVAGIHHRPELGALTCYFLAFEGDADLARRRYAYAYRPAGGPRILASLRNVYGDATAIYRAEAFRAVGGYETDRDTSFEDWEAFVKLTRAGYAVDVLPAHLFSYRHRPAGFSRVTAPYANHERVLRQFRAMDGLPPEERATLWGALVGFHRRADRLAARQRCLRYRVADGVHAACRRVPLAVRSARWLRGLLAGRAKGVSSPSTQHPCCLDGSGGA